MDSDTPRYRPIAGGNRADSSAIDEWASGFRFAPIGGSDDGNSRNASRANDFKYRIRTAVLSGFCFAAGTGIAVTYAVTGR